MLERFIRWLFGLNPEPATPSPDAPSSTAYTVKLAFTSSTRPSWSKTVTLPAEGRFVTESHYATTSDKFGTRLFPTTQTEGMTAHLERSLAYMRGLFPTVKFDDLYPVSHTWTRQWTPPENGKAGQGSVGDVKPSVEEEVWQGNMMWAKGAKPKPGTRFMLKNPANGKACVIQMGYETGPGSQDYLGGVTREVHWYLGSGNDTKLALSKVDDATKLGPVKSGGVVAEPKPVDADDVFAKRGQSSSNVEQLRVTLNNRGIDAGPADHPVTKYGPKISAAVSIAKGKLGIKTSADVVTESELDAIESLPVDEPDRPSVGTPGQKLLSHPTAIKSYPTVANGKFRKGYPEGLIVHFTAGQCDDEGDMIGSMQWGKGEGYAFWGIGPTGKLYQGHPLDRWGHHAGSSSWKGLGSSVSQYLLGVEIAAGGRLSNGKTWFGKSYPASKLRTVTARDNMVAGTYVAYTREQEETLVEFCLWLKRNNPDVFSFDLVLGHDEVAPGRKNDPGGALSMSMPEFRAHLKKEYAERYG